MTRLLMILEVIHFGHLIAAFSVWAATKCCYGEDFYIGGSPPPTVRRYIRTSPTITRHLIYFKAPGCIPCKQVERNLDGLNYGWKQGMKRWEIGSLSEETKDYADQYHVLKVDAHEEEDFADAYGVDACPTFILIERRDGKPKELKRYTGILSTQEIINLFNDGTVPVKAKQKPRTERIPIAYEFALPQTRETDSYFRNRNGSIATYGLSVPIRTPVDAVPRMSGPPRPVDYVPYNVVSRSQLIQHLSTGGHSYSPQYLNSLSTQDLKDLHDNDHNGGRVSDDGRRLANY